MSNAPDTVVHLAAEYWPYARTGGLAEAVRGIAVHQARSGSRTLVVMPLYRRVRDAYPGLEPVGDAFAVPMPWGEETVRMHRDPGTGTTGVEVYFVEHDGYFGRPGIYGEGWDYADNLRRFATFSRAALQWLPSAVPEPPVIHPHDWHCALAPVLLRTHFAGSAWHDRVGTVLTVHNAGYQGHYGPEVMAELGLPWDLYRFDRLEWYGKVNILKGGLVFSDMVTTVSPTHAHELRTRFGGFGLHDAFNHLQDRFVGVLNGIDYTVWNPEEDPVLARRYTPGDLSGKAVCKAWFQKAVRLDLEPETPLFALSARLVEQKGLDLILGADMIPRLPAQFVFLGEGEGRYKDAIATLGKSFPGRVGYSFHFTEKREHKLLAAADFLLMPSLYEPCGLTQMRAQRYGALPVARRVGGLADTIDDRNTGFLFDEYAPWALEDAVQWAIDLYQDREAWEEHVREAMGRDFSWERSANTYAGVYRRARSIRDARVAREG